MKKFLISAMFILGFTGYVAYTYVTNRSSSSPAVAAGTASTSSTTPQSVMPATSVPVLVVPVVKKPSMGQYKDGSYTGSVADAYYGNIQVRAVISGGKLTDVAFLQYPNDRSTSVAINQQAMPQLRAEALKAQSAKVDGVSGASDSSTAFTVSLASALSKAKA